MKGKALIVQFDAGLAGAAISGLMLADGLRDDAWETHVVFGAAGPMTEAYRAASHRVHLVEHKNWLRSRRHHRLARNLIREYPAIQALRRLMRDLRPDLVYVNTAASFAGAMAARQERIPCYWHIRELFSDVGGELIVPAGMKPAVRVVIRTCARHVIVNSSAVLGNVIGGSFHRPIDIVPNAVDDCFFSERVGQAEAREQLDLPPDGDLIGVPGTLRPMKGHPFFLRGFRRLVEAFPGVTAAVTGAGEPRYIETLNRQAKDLGLTDKIRFLGPIQAMPAFYRACNLVCVPSLAEPFGRTVIEAFASGTAVVASNVGGIREIVDHERTGLLVPYGDAPALASSLARLLTDRTLRDAMAQNAIRKARADFQASQYKARICAIVRETPVGEHVSVGHPD